MANYRVLIGSIAFGISFSFSLLLNRDVSKAVGAGLTTLPAAVIAVAIADHRLYQQANQRIATLKQHINALQRRRAEAYQAFAELSAEREQIALEISSMQAQRDPFRLPATPVAAALPPRKSLSFDVSGYSVPPTVISTPREQPTQLQELPPTEIRNPHQQQTVPDRDQTDLSQIQPAIAEQRQQREKLRLDVSQLTEQKQHLETQTQALRSEVQELEQRRVELEQFLSYAEGKKREMELGTHPLQISLKQLQQQTLALQEEVQTLEQQIQERQQQRDSLEPQNPGLRSRPLRPNPARKHAGQGSKNGTSPNGESPQPSPREKTSLTPVPSSRSSVATASVSLSSPPEAALGQTTQPRVHQHSSDLPDEWAEFLGQLPDYEVQVLKVIAEQGNPTPVLKKIAEENLTMPELLIDSINERALETIGDILVEVKAGTGSATIARDHTKLVKRLLKHYEDW